MLLLNNNRMKLIINKLIKVKMKILIEIIRKLIIKY